MIDPHSGKAIKTQLFVAVWGASTYTFAEATLTQQLPDWIGSHTRALEYFGCCLPATLAVCTLINAQWIVFMSKGKGLEIGYHAWLGAFLLLTVAAFVRASADRAAIPVNQEGEHAKTSA